MSAIVYLSEQLKLVKPQIDNSSPGAVTDGMRIKFGHTAVLDIESSSVTLKPQRKETEKNTFILNILTDSQRKDLYKIEIV